MLPYVIHFAWRQMLEVKLCMHGMPELRLRSLCCANVKAAAANRLVWSLERLYIP